MRVKVNIGYWRGQLLSTRGFDTVSFPPPGGPGVALRANSKLLASILTHTLASLSPTLVLGETDWVYVGWARVGYRVLAGMALLGVSVALSGVLLRWANLEALAR